MFLFFSFFYATYAAEDPNHTNERLKAGAHLVKDVVDIARHGHTMNVVEALKACKETFEDFKTAALGIVPYKGSMPVWCDRDQLTIRPQGTVVQLSHGSCRRFLEYGWHPEHIELFAQKRSSARETDGGIAARLGDMSHCKLRVPQDVGDYFTHEEIAEPGRFLTQLQQKQHSQIPVCHIPQVSRCDVKGESSAEDLDSQGVAYYTKQDYRKALEFFSAAVLADQNHASGLYHMGMLYYNGHAVSQDYREAINFFQRSANLEEKKAQNMMGEIYLTGNIPGFAKNYDQVAFWQSKAATQGHPRAMFVMGWLCQNGLGGQMRGQELVWFQEAAKKNDPHAQDALRKMGKGW